MAGLSETECRDLMKSGTGVTFARGNILLREGDPGGTLYLILSGYVKVTMSSAGTDVVLAVRGRGDLLGEFTVIDGKPRTATVVALSALTTVRISRSRFLAFREGHLNANERIMQSLTDKVRRASDRSAATRVPDSQTRLAHMLYELAMAHGVPQADGTVLVPPLTQSDMADLTAVAGSTVERILKEFRNEGLVLNRYRRTVVVDVAALRARAQLSP
jgi:CRP/FNR family cyclic AMP-dependent transcriptional regulator